MSQLQRIEQQAMRLQRELQHGLVLLDSVQQPQERVIQLPMSKLMQMAKEEQEKMLETQKRLAPRPHVARLVLIEAELDQQVCSISMEPLRLETGCCVGPCYHAFQKTAIQMWLRTSKLCPVCRDPCVL